MNIRLKGVYYKANDKYSHYFDIIIETNLGFVSLAFGEIVKSCKPTSEWKVFEPAVQWLKNKGGSADITSFCRSYENCYLITPEEVNTLSN